MKNSSDSNVSAHQLRLGAALLVFTLVSSIIHAGTLSGKVADEASDTGLPGVIVVVKPSSGAPLPAVLSDGQGHYQVSDVPPGAAEIEFTESAYLLNPTVVKFTVTADPQEVPNVPLFQKAYNTEYLLKIGQKITGQANGDSASAEALWSRYDSLPIPFSAKAELAQVVMSNDTRLAKAPSYAAFSAFNVAEIRRVEMQLDQIKEKPNPKLRFKSTLPANVIEKVIRVKAETLPATDRALFMHDAAVAHVKG